jgi:hypothetical protein
MPRWKTNLGAFALGLAVIATATPTFAAQRTANHDWRAARAQAIPDSDMTLSGGRASALRACNGAVASMKEYTWGELADQHYRSCMAEHGQAE